jgi:hypothetical protein
MAIYKATSFHHCLSEIFFISTVSRCAHNKVRLVTSLDLVPESIRGNITVLKHFRRTACQRVQSFTCLASLNSLITTEDFGPGFF